MFRRHVVALVTFALLAGCEASKQRAVKAHLPVSRLELPEPSEHMFGGGVAAIGLTRLRLTEDQTQQEPTAAPPSAYTHGSLMGKLEVTPLPLISVSVKAYGFPVGGPQIKVMPLAALAPRSPLSLAGTFHYAEFQNNYAYDSTESGEPYAYTSVNSRLRDYALIAGLRLSPQFLVFGGPYRSKLHYGGEYRSSSVPSKLYEQDTEGAGGNFGLAWTPFSWMRVVGEVSRARLTTGARRERVWAPGLAAEFSFGPSPYRGQLAQPEEPVRVVPVAPVKPVAPASP